MNKVDMNKAYKRIKFGAVLCLLILAVVTLGGCGQEKNGKEREVTAVNMENAQLALNNARETLLEGLKNINGLDDESVFKVEGVSLVIEDDKTWLWCGIRSVDLVNTGAAALLESEDQGKTWTFKGKMTDYPSSLESQLRAAEIFDIEDYLQSYANRTDSNHITIGEFALSEEEKTQIMEKAKTETWYSAPLELIKHESSKYGFPENTIFTSQLDYYYAIVNNVTYYVFALPISDEENSPYYIARIMR